MNLETAQIVIVIALSISTVLLTIIGLQVIFLLKSIRKIVRRGEKISQGFEQMINGLERAFSDLGDIAGSGRLFLKIVGKIFNGKNKDE